MKRGSRKSASISAIDQQIFEELCAILSGQGIEIRIEKGSFRGGGCRVEDDKRYFFLNRKDTLDRRMALLLEEVKRLEEEVEQPLLTDPLKAKLSRRF